MSRKFCQKRSGISNQVFLLEIKLGKDVYSKSRHPFKKSNYKLRTNFNQAIFLNCYRSWEMILIIWEKAELYKAKWATLYVKENVAVTPVSFTFFV